MNVNQLLPQQDTPSGPKDTSKSRNTTSRKKDEPHPRFAWRVLDVVASAFQSMSPRRSHLRLLAVSVEEQGPGKFVWCLRESTGDVLVYEPIQRASSTFSTYGAAMAGAYAEWQRVVSGDGDNGPRSTSEDENADPVGDRVTAGPLMPPGKLSRRKLSASGDID